MDSWIDGWMYRLNDVEKRLNLRLTYNRTPIPVERTPFLHGSYKGLEWASGGPEGNQMAKIEKRLKLKLMHSQSLTKHG